MENLKEIIVLLCAEDPRQQKQLTELCTQKGATRVLHAGDLKAAQALVRSQERIDLIIWCDMQTTGTDEVQAFLREAAAKFSQTERISADSDPALRTAHEAAGFSNVGPMSLLPELHQTFRRMMGRT